MRVLPRPRLGRALSAVLSAIGGPRGFAACAIVAIAALTCTGRAPAGRPGTAPVPTREAPAAEWKATAAADELAALRGENGRLKRLNAQLAGKVERKPEQVVIYDTVIPPPDTMLIEVYADSRGRADITTATAVDSGYQPRTGESVNLSDCDDGFRVSASGVVCNRARLGHLDVFARAGLTSEYQGTAAAGLSWRPSYRSTATVQLYMDERARLNLSVQKGVRIF